MKQVVTYGLVVALATIAVLALPGVVGARGSAPRAEAAATLVAPQNGRPTPRQVAALKRQISKLQAEVRRLRRQVAAISPAGVAAQLAQTKAALERFRSVDAAAAAGYVPSGPCETTTEGSMGVHWVNPPLLQDPAIDPLRPEILLYAPGPSGPELVGVEYWKADTDQNLGTDDDRPTLFGRTFDGPMPGHIPTMPIHFDLHVYLWKRNPTGIFTKSNPDVRCS